MKRALFLTSVLVTGTTFSAAALENDSIRNVDLDEVVINATKASKGTPMSYTDISSEDLEKSNYGQDIPYLISQTPSVIVTSDAGTGIGYTSFRVRGTDANRINITVNGVPMNDSESHGVFWVNMPDFASSTENVQIQRGAGTSTNGAAAFGASIMLQTKNPEMKPYGEYSSAAGSFATFKNTFKGGTGLIKDHFVFDARYSKITSDGYIDRAKADMSSYWASAAYYAGSTMIKYQIFGSDERTNQAWNGVPAEMIEAGNRTYNSCGKYTDNEGNTKYYDNSDNYWQTHQHLSLIHKVDENWSMNATLHYTFGKGYYEDYKTGRSLTEYELTPFLNGKGEKVETSDLIRQKWLKNDFYGAIYNINYSDEKNNVTLGLSANNYDGAHYGYVIWARNYNNLDPQHKYYDGDGEKLDYTAFIRANHKLTAHLNAYVDLQYRGIDYKISGTDDTAGKLDVDKKFDFFNPKAGVNYSNGGHNAFASFSMANREPNRNNYTEAGESERPTYETLYDYELGYTFSTKFWNVGFTAYYMDYNNQLILNGKISEIGEALTSNIKDSYRMGIELMGGVQICKELSWKGNVAFSQNKIDNFVEYLPTFVGKDRIETDPTVISHGKTDISFSPEIVANSIFDFNWKRFNANFSTVYVGSQFIDNTSNRSRQIDAYFVSNIQLGYTFKPKFVEEFGLSLRINNLFDEEYETNAWVYTAIADGYDSNNRYTEKGYFTQAGTNFMCSMSIKF